MVSKGAVFCGKCAAALNPEATGTSNFVSIVSQSGIPSQASSMNASSGGQSVRLKKAIRGAEIRAYVAAALAVAILILLLLIVFQVIG